MSEAFTVEHYLPNGEILNRKRFRTFDGAADHAFFKRTMYPFADLRLRVGRRVTVEISQKRLTRAELSTLVLIAIEQERRHAARDAQTKERNP